MKKLFCFILLFILGGIVENVAMATSIVWKGYTWNLRDDRANSSPGYGAWSSANITGPDANGYLTLKVTNPTGSQPIGCEMGTQKAGWGYGTYTAVVEGDMTTFDKNIVFGGLFLFYHGNPYIEFDACETSKWNGYATTQIIHNSWYGTYPSALKSHGVRMAIPSDTVQTHRLIWQEGKATFDSFIGTGTEGTPYFHTEITQDVPPPGSEVVVFNMWTTLGGLAGSTPGATDLDAPETSVILRDFTFTPLSSTPTPTPTPTTKPGQRKGQKK
ncbi:MAG: hypothetical protein LUQ70_02660 [Methanobacteriaceae archaeon]|nr:hypothetical protein [Methanobacteriaceae archaeon]